MPITRDHLIRWSGLANGLWLVGVGVPLVTFGPLADNNLGLIGAVLGGWGYIWLGWVRWAKYDVPRLAE